MSLKSNKNTKRVSCILPSDWESKSYIIQSKDPEDKTVDEKIK